MLGRHELLVRLAAGGAANVFLVRDTKAPPPGRLLALKVLQPSLAANEDFLNMFFTEAKIATRLKHKNVVRIAGFGRTAGIHCLAMEYVFGASLAQVLRASARARKPLTVGVLLRITAQMCDALHYAHELREDNGEPMSIVHRDVTPQNILIGFNGVPKLTDFGIAKATNRGWETQAGIVKGKFCYMSPEQALGKKVDRRSDIFCSGIVLWEALTGKELFKGSTPMEVLQAIREQKIEQPSKVVPGLSPIVDPIVMKALRRSPRQRYQSAMAMKEDIEELIRRAGVTIDASTISKEFAEIFGDVIVDRAFALRAAMAGKADGTELSKALGGQKLSDDFLPEMMEGTDDPDPLGLFSEDSYAESFDDDAIGMALPARTEQPFTKTHDRAELEPPVAETAQPPEEDLQELVSMEPEEPDDSGAFDGEEIEGWSDHTKMMEPDDELLALLSEEDATIGMLPLEFTRRFGDAIARKDRDSGLTADDDDGFDEKTVDVTALREELERESPSSPSSPKIPADQTVLQPRKPLEVHGGGKRKRKGERPRPVPRAPSLDMADDRTPLPDLEATAEAAGLELLPTAIDPAAEIEVEIPSSDSFVVELDPSAVAPVPMSDPEIEAGTEALGSMPESSIPKLPTSALSPLPTDALSPLPQSGHDEESRQILAAGQSSELSPASLRELVGPDAPTPIAPQPSQEEVSPGWPNAAPAWQTGQVKEEPSGVRIRPVVLVLFAVALIVLGIAIGVMLDRLGS